jgi:histidine triad (HIT) family protein
LSENCIFCRVARGEIPASTVFEEDDLVAFHDIDPKAPTHVLVIPRRHITSVDALTEADAGIAGRLLLAARRVARETGIAEGGFRLVVNTGEEGGQSVDHLHVHVLGGRSLVWPPG